MRQEQNPPAFTFPVRVFFEDTDAGGVVYYANYLKFLERCRSEWLRTLGYDQSALMRDASIAFVVRSVNVDYLKPARLDDLLTICLDVERITRSQIFFRQHIRQPDGEIILTSQVQIVCVNSALMKIVSIPAPLRTQLEAIQ